MPDKDNFFTIEKLRELAENYHSQPAAYSYLNDGIFVMECGVAGTGHIPEIESRLQEVYPGSILSFVREYFNDYDEWAICINNANGEKIGYIPRKKNEILAHLMDAGKQFYAEVIDLWYPESDNWVNIIIRVYMKND